MINTLIAILNQSPATGDDTPVKASFIVIGIAVVVAVVSLILSKKKK